MAWAGHVPRVEELVATVRTDREPWGDQGLATRTLLGPSFTITPWGFNIDLHRIYRSVAKDIASEVKNKAIFFARMQPEPPPDHLII